MDLERITHPLRLAKGSHQPGSGKGFAMKVISYINGDTHITDFPDCSARLLAAFVQVCNDLLSGPDDYLSPENSLLALELGRQTVGTADDDDTVIQEWVAELVAIETPRGPLVAALRATGRPVCAVSPMAVAATANGIPWQARNQTMSIPRRRPLCTGPIAVLRRGKHLQQGADTDCGEAGGDVTVVSGNFHETIGLGVEMDAGVAYVGDLSGETRAVNLDGGGETLLVKTKAA